MTLGFILIFDLAVLLFAIAITIIALKLKCLNPPTSKTIKVGKSLIIWGPWISFIGTFIGNLGLVVNSFGLTQNGTRYVCFSFLCLGLLLLVIGICLSIKSKEKATSKATRKFENISNNQNTDDINLF